MKLTGVLLLSVLFVPVWGAPAYAGQGEKTALADVPYNFDSAKLAAAQSPFLFFRAYVDYYYLLVQANKNALPSLSATGNMRGWCVGDAHAENFGVLLRSSTDAVFTMNDMDDSGPCPVVLDIFRLMGGARLSGSEIRSASLLAAYAAGLKGETYAEPAAVAGMMKKSLKKGLEPDPKKINAGNFVRTAATREVSAAERVQLAGAVFALGNALKPGAVVADAMATSKAGGGSGGLLRYEVLVNNGGALLHLEFKELAAPAIYPVAGPLPPQSERVSQTLLLTQGAGASALYKVVSLGGRQMLARPRFDGNTGVKLAKLEPTEAEAVILYEAYTLGRIHAASVADSGELLKNIQAVPESVWAADVKTMAEFFVRKFKELKN